MIATTVTNGFKLDLGLRQMGNAAVSVRLLDRYRFELPGKGGTAPVRVGLETTESAGVDDSCLLHKRTQEIFGPASLQFSTGEVWLPDPLPTQTAYLGICIRQSRVSTARMTKAQDATWERTLDTIYLEVSLRKLELGRHGACSLFLLTKANDRIEVVAKHCGLFDRDDDASNDALTNLMLRIISGEDSPLLTEWLEDDDEGEENDDNQ